MSKLAILKAESYEFLPLKEKILALFEYLGGLENIIPSNSKLLLKPNLLSARLPESCVNTHPEFVRAVIEVLKKRTSRIQLGDSPGGYANYEEVLEKSGMKKIAQESGIEIVKFEKSKLVDSIPIAEEVLDADMVISLPKFKTHCLTIITAGVKNCFGCIPGLFKSQVHKENPKAIDLSRVLLKVYRIVRPRITIVDAIYSMQGDGPSAGNPRKTGLILAGQDAVSVDSVLSYLIGVDPLTIPTNRIAYQEGLGETELKRIEIVPGPNWDEFRIDNFQLPRISLLERLPQPLISLAGKLIKFYPEIIPDKCVKCGICLKSCPVEAISFSAHSAIIDHKKCILCLCCQEVCPESAVEVKRSYLAKKLGI